MHTIKKEILNLVPAQFAAAHGVVAFHKTADELAIAILDPGDIQTIEFLHRKTGLTPKVYMTSPSDIKEALRTYHADLSTDQTIVQLSTEGEHGNAKDLKKAAEELPIINIVNSILEPATGLELSLLTATNAPDWKKSADPLDAFSLYVSSYVNVPGVPPSVATINVPLRTLSLRLIA